MRIDRFLCETVNITRKEAKELIKKNKVYVNDKPAKDSGMIIDENSDKIICQGEIIQYEKYVYYMLNKPADYLSATNDPVQKTVIDLLKNENKSGLFPVGRLDKDTVGLLIITNDGNLAHHLTSPSHHVPKTYYLEIDHALSDEDINKLENGIELKNDGITKPAEVKMITETSLTLTISEGMYHQVKRMLLAVGNEVKYLKRLSVGNVILDEALNEGEYRRLTNHEIELLKG